MSVAIPIPLLQHLPDVNVTPAVGVDEYALVYDHDTARFVLRAPAAPFAGILATGATVGATAQAQAFTLGVVSPFLAPAADSTTAWQVRKADKTTAVVTVDTTNGRVGIGTTSPQNVLHVWTDVNYGGMRFTNTLDTGAISIFGSTLRAITMASWKGWVGSGSVTDGAIGTQTALGLFTNDETTARVYIGTTGRVGIGTTSPAALLHADQSSTTGAVPVLTVDQADVSEEFIRFIGTSTTDATQSLVDAADMTTPGALAGWLKIYVQDDQATNPITDGAYYVPFYAAPTA